MVALKAEGRRVQSEATAALMLEKGQLDRRLDVKEAFREEEPEMDKVTDSISWSSDGGHWEEEEEGGDAARRTLLGHPTPPSFMGSKGATVMLVPCTVVVNCTVTRVRASPRERATSQRSATPASEEKVDRGRSTTTEPTGAGEGGA